MKWEYTRHFNVNDGWLEKLGQREWELVSVVLDDPATQRMAYIFKRPLPEDSDDIWIPL